MSPIFPFATLGACFMLAACASAPEPEPTFVEAPPAPAPAPPAVIGVPYPQPVPGQAKPMPEAAPTSGMIEVAEQARRPVDEVIDEANSLSAQAPTPEGYVNSIQVYDFMPGALYQVWGAPNHLTTISFAVGEQVLSIAAGDTVRWITAETESGQGATLQKHILIQPVRRDLHTTMVVTTTLGVYQFELRSYQHTYLAHVSFRYPHGQLLAMSARPTWGAEGASQASPRPQGDEAGMRVRLEDLEDRYRLVVEDRDDPPIWTPRRVFHDGQRTYIEFPRALGEGEQPALFLLSKKKTPRIVQYTQEGRYMVVPMVVQRAMLRLGERGEAEQVGIELKQEATR